MAVSFSRFISTLASALVISACASVAHASGSDSFPSSSSGTSQYNLGKQVFAEKLACKGCVFDGKSINGEIAKQIVNDKKATEKLSADDRDAVITYAKRRFKL